MFTYTSLYTNVRFYKGLPHIRLGTQRYPLETRSFIGPPFNHNLIKEDLGRRVMTHDFWDRREKNAQLVQK